MFKLLLLFICVPLGELYLLLLLGRYIGALNTVLIVILTGVIGGYLTRREGLSTLRKIREKLSKSKLPGGELLDGAFILISGVLLITPGIITDLLGFLGLVPLTRKVMKRIVLKRLKRAIESGQISVYIKRT
jgi:UPF0716 protein FxsA